MQQQHLEKKEKSIRFSTKTAVFDDQFKKKHQIYPYFFVCRGEAVAKEKENKSYFLYFCTLN